MVLSTQATRHHLTKSTDAIHQAAARAEPKIRRAVLRLLESAQATVPDLEAMIRRGDIDAVWRAVKGLEPSKATAAALVDAVASAGIQSGAAEAARFSMAFNEPAEEAIRFAARDAAKLGMHDMDKGLVRTILSRGVEQGHHPRVTARHLKAITPILPRHQKSVDRYYQGILDGGGTEAYARRMADRKATKLKRYRAKMIARTEASRSANMGQQAIWDQAIAADLLPADTKKKWVATPGACPICTNLDGKTVPVRGTFTTGGQSPPAHPHCRCTMVIDRIPTPERQRTPEPVTRPTLRQPNDFTSVADAEDWLRAQGIDTVDLSNITRLESAKEIGRAVETVNQNYPWYAERTRQPGQGLTRLVCDDNATRRLDHFSAAGQTRRTRDGVEIALNGDVVNSDYLFDMFSAGDHSLYNTMLHEFGHALHYELGSAEQVRGALSPWNFYSPNATGPWSKLDKGRGTFMREVSMYADENGAEFFGEMFAIKNSTGYEGRLAESYWRRSKPPATAVRRMEAAESMIKEQLAPFAKAAGIDPEAIL